MENYSAELRTWLYGMVHEFSQKKSQIEVIASNKYGTRSNPLETLIFFPGK